MRDKYGTPTTKLDPELIVAQQRIAALETELVDRTGERDTYMKSYAGAVEDSKQLCADLAAARAECDTLWAYVHSGVALTNHEDSCVICGHNDVPCAEKKRLEAENMRAFDAVINIDSK